MKLSEVFFNDDDIIADSSDLKDFVSPPDSDQGIKCSCGKRDGRQCSISALWIVKSSQFPGALWWASKRFGQDRTAPGSRSRVVKSYDRTAGNGWGRGPYWVRQYFRGQG